MAAAAVRYLRADPADRSRRTTHPEAVVEALPRPELRCVGEDERAPVDQAEFRRVLGNFATGVTVITAPPSTRSADAPAPTGHLTEHLTGHLDGLPADRPARLRLPVVLVPLARSAAGRVHGRPYVDDLAPDRPRGRLLRERTRRGPGRLVPELRGERRGQVRRCRPHPGPRHGLPRLTGAAAWIDCTIHAVHTGGDHLIVVGRVKALGTDDEATRPLLFHRGRFGQLRA